MCLSECFSILAPAAERREKVDIGRNLERYGRDLRKTGDKGSRVSEQTGREKSIVLQFVSLLFESAGRRAFGVVVLFGKYLVQHRTKRKIPEKMIVLLLSGQR